MKASFENSVSVLVRAYMNGTLEHANCYACAVGNLVVAAKRLTFIRDERDGLMTLESLNANNEAGANWFDVALRDRKKKDWMNTLSSDCLSEIQSTGYTIPQILRIERAFESADFREGDWMFNGLMAVVDVLADIHGVDLSVKETAIGQFKEVQALKLV